MGKTIEIAAMIGAFDARGYGFLTSPDPRLNGERVFFLQSMLPRGTLPTPGTYVTAVVSATSRGWRATRLEVL